MRYFWWLDRRYCGIADGIGVWIAIRNGCGGRLVWSDHLRDSGRSARRNSYTGKWTNMTDDRCISNSSGSRYSRDGQHRVRFAANYNDFCPGRHLPNIVWCIEGWTIYKIHSLSSSIMIYDGYWCYYYRLTNFPIARTSVSQRDYRCITKYHDPFVSD